MLLPKLVGLEDAIAQTAEGDPLWLAVGVGFCVAMFAAYVALFRGVIGDSGPDLQWREGYQITMAGLAATRLFSAGGAGGIVLTYWALRKAGMELRRAASRMVAFLVLLYVVYMVALVVFGVLLRTGVLAGDAPVGMTIVPAALAGVVMALFAGIALIPKNLDARLGRISDGSSLGARLTRRLATVPATMGAGTRQALAFLRHPKRGGLALIGAVGFWAANIGILWACFEAYDVSVPPGVLVQGFFIGMVANLIPFVPGGVGAVDAGMIGAFVLFGQPEAETFAAILGYRLIAFWLPIPPGIVAYFQLRRTVNRWEQCGAARTMMGPSWASPPRLT
ncbi:MAG: lysylphosphatidylglycerol synthase transmembrane domain-containing protein, partial [Solirubrobacterales bacterium]